MAFQLGVSGILAARCGTLRLADGFGAPFFNTVIGFFPNTKDLWH